MASAPTRQKEEPHNRLLVLLDLLPRFRRRSGRRDHMAGRKRHVGQDYGE